MPSILNLPKWAQAIIDQQRHRYERAERQVKRLNAEVEKQSGEKQSLLDIVRNLRPDLFDKWNTGTPLEYLVELSKKETI